MLVKIKDTNNGKENIAVILEGFDTLESVYYLEENLLNLIIMASDTLVREVPPLDRTLLNVLSLVKSMRPTGDDIQLIERKLPIIETKERI